MESTIKCYYCDTSSRVFGDVIKHSIDKHENQTLQVKIESATEKFTRNFTIKPRDMHERGKVIIPNDDSWTVKVSRSLQTPSPLVKVQKKLKRQVSSTPKRLDFDIEAKEILVAEKIENLSIDDMDTLEPMFGESGRSIDETEHVMPSVIETVWRENQDIEPEEILIAENIESLSGDNIDTIEPMFDESESLIDEIERILHSVIETVRKENQEEMYLKFNHLLAENKLQVTNIAYLLFKDIVEWYSLDKSTSMRYSPEVKQFWRVGYKLFKGRFLRFMSGMKNQGQDGVSSHLNHQ